MPQRYFVSGGGLFLTVFVYLLATRAGAAPATPGFGAPPSVNQAASVPASECRQCHDGPSVQALPTFHQDCVSCHTGAAEHVKDPSLTNIEIPAAVDCLTCHKSDARLMRWEFGPHARTEVACADCHSIHAAKPTELRNVGDRTMQDTTRLCATCHKDTLA